MRSLKYNHPSVPPKDIELGKVYDLEYLESLFGLDNVKILFKPIDFTWTSLNKQNKTKLVTLEKDTVESESVKADF
jgi:hypothetical protein